ncbi:hypothetical protein BCR44DRAFT_1500467 [Catenaria anguillulae PL171]|uniref:Uncharacterized protein n=1 Tax=Catenaria anguillulae PL171 TaxID=765915 RepID=A0A1Y2HIP5_9FUNG|nr:hypothetical protein BCR44DRAFT_1500467 [Catenaria anguillulae PL171]
MHPDPNPNTHQVMSNSQGNSWDDNAPAFAPSHLAPLGSHLMKRTPTYAPMPTNNAGTAARPTRVMPLNEASGEIRQKLAVSKATDVVVLVQATHRSIVATLLAKVEARDNNVGRLYRTVGEVVAHVPAMVNLAMSDSTLVGTLVYSHNKVTYKSTWPVRALLWGTAEHLASATSADDERCRVGEAIQTTIWDCTAATKNQRPRVRLETSATLRSVFVPVRDGKGGIVGLKLDARAARTPMYGGVELRMDQRGQEVVVGVDAASVSKWFHTATAGAQVGVPPHATTTINAVDDRALATTYDRYPGGIKNLCRTLWVLGALQSFGADGDGSLVLGSADTAADKWFDHDGHANPNGRPMRACVSTTTARAIAQGAFFARDFMVHWIVLSPSGVPCLARVRMATASNTLFPKRAMDRRGLADAIDRAAAEIQHRFPVLLRTGLEGAAVGTGHGGRPDDAAWDMVTAHMLEDLGYALTFRHRHLSAAVNALGLSTPKSPPASGSNRWHSSLPSRPPVPAADQHHQHGYRAHSTHSAANRPSSAGRDRDRDHYVAASETTNHKQQQQQRRWSSSFGGSSGDNSNTSNSGFRR